jgi:hypothetical protein
MGHDLTVQLLDPSTKSITSVISTKPPYLIQTASLLSVTSNEKAFHFKPSSTFTSELISSPWITPDDIAFLKQYTNQKNFGDNLDHEDFIDFTVISILLLLFPATMALCVRYLQSTDCVVRMVDASFAPVPTNSHRQETNLAMNRRVSRSLHR